MLREFKYVRQEPGPGKRRWWGGDDMEFTVWYDADTAITGYQLYYRGCAFTWQNSGYWTHVGVGESFGNGCRIAGYGVPILMAKAAGSRPPFDLLTRFERASYESVSREERDLVTRTLHQVVRQKRN